MANVAFFPVYPLTIKLCTLLSPANSAVAAMLIANAAFLATLYLLRALCRATADEATAQRAILYITVFPTAFYSYAPYSESLYLLASTASLLALHRRRWWAAGACGALAAATRVLGVFLLFAFALEYLRAHRRRALRPTLRAAALISAAWPPTYSSSPTSPAIRGLRQSGSRLASHRHLALADARHQPRRYPQRRPPGIALQAHAILEITSSWPAPPLCWPPCPPTRSSSLYALARAAFLLTAPVTTSRDPDHSMSRYLFALAPSPPPRLPRPPAACHAPYLTLATGTLTLLASFTLCHMWGA